MFVGFSLDIVVRCIYASDDAFDTPSCSDPIIFK